MPNSPLEHSHGPTSSSDPQRCGSVSLSSPDVILERHWRLVSRRRRLQGPLATLVLTATVMAGLLGRFGLPDQTRTVTVPRADLEVYGPRVIRNGEFSELRMHVRER